MLALRMFCIMTICPAASDAQVIDYCSARGCDRVEFTRLGLIDPGDSMVSADRVVDLLHEITRATSLPPAFKVRRVQGLNNALAKVAHHPNGIIRVIEYDPNLFEAWERYASKSVHLVVAHEIGHHLSNHVFYRESDSRAENHRTELQADYFAGASLARLGVSRAAASRAVEVLSAHDSHTHPGRERRRQKVFEGWDSVSGEETRSDSSQSSSQRQQKNRNTTPGPDSCTYARDGQCDEPEYCSPGTDTHDCTHHRQQTQAGPDSCVYARNGQCDEPYHCHPGTDTHDCTHHQNHQQQVAYGSYCCDPWGNRMESGRG